MRFVCADYESYFDSDFTLSNCRRNTISEIHIRNSRHRRKVEPSHEASVHSEKSGSSFLRKRLVDVFTVITPPL